MVIEMYFKEDNTYSDMIKNSTMQWLSQVSEGEDVVNKHGAKLTIEYIAYLNKKIEQLNEQVAMRDEFLKRMKTKSV